MARRADHTREELKKLVLDSAWRIVGKDGFENLTARKIAAEIGYAPGSIYNVFNSMDDLYLHINSRTLDMLYEDLDSDKYDDSPKPMIANMKVMATRYAFFAKKYRPYWFMLFNHTFSEGWQSPPWYQEKIEKLFDPLEKLLYPLFTPKQAKKRKIAARTLWASVHGIYFLEQSGKIPVVDDKEAPEKMSHLLIDSFVAGIKSKAGD